QAFAPSHAVLSAVRPSPVDGENTRVLFDVAGLQPAERLAVFVDPVTAQLHGTLIVYGTSGVLPLRTWLDQFHRSLLLGDLGRNYSELAASWLWVTALGGLIL
ncbi:MAG: PepSY domain-containing protein, partial [Serratia symbiotica]|nr:PepSY domain-containing protein [Serratia symbiotica]